MNIDELKSQLQHRVAFTATGMAMREDSEKPVIDGVAIVVNQETILWEEPDYREIEVIDPNCIREEFIRTQDIKLNLLHERKLSFNRYPTGALVLDTREDGLHFSAPGDDSAIARQATDLIKNGTYTGCSFEFWAKDYEISERVAADGKTEYIIRHKEFAKIGAITIGMDPAYEQTSVNARELFREMNREDEPEKQDDPEKPDHEDNTEEDPDEEAKAKAECDKKREQQIRDNQITIIQMDEDNL